MEVLFAFALMAAYFTTVPVGTDVTVTLPKVDEDHSTDTPLVVSLGAAGEIYLSAELVTRAELQQHLTEMGEVEREASRVFVRTHPKLQHAHVSEILAMISAAGFDNIALVQGGNGSALEGSMIPAQE